MSLVSSQTLPNYREYLWRGQRNAKWELYSSLDRLRRTSGKAIDRDVHLQEFKRAALGRRGPFPPPLQDDEQWWALGQHFGLATPLLDWTASPFVAAFFAFTEPDTKVTERAVFALCALPLMEKYKEAITAGGSTRPLPMVTVPELDENSRLISQAGAFTSLPDGYSVESCIRISFPGHLRPPVLFKFLLPNKERETCLKDLVRMNIHPASLFPDLSGASQFCNIRSSIHGY